MRVDAYRPHEPFRGVFGLVSLVGGEPHGDASVERDQSVGRPSLTVELQRVDFRHRPLQDFGNIGPHELAQHTVIVNVGVKTIRELVDALVEVCLQDSTMNGESVSKKLKRNVRENNCIFTLKHRRSVRCSQEHEHVVLYTMLDESQRDVRLDAVVE